MAEATLKVFSTLGLAGVLREIEPRFAQARLATTMLEVALLPSAVWMERIRGGATADVAILLADSIDALAAAGILRQGRTDLARSLVGIAVRAGAPRPDISSVDAFVATMRAAKSVALSGAGASGLYFAALLPRLGIADEVMAKATVIPSGFTGELVRRGEAEIAVQQVSELKAVPGIDIVGTLPAGIEGVSVFSAGIFAGSGRKEEAEALIGMLAAEEAGAIYAANGLEALF
jgi:molybdate transport system substrate-binding protein